MTNLKDVTERLFALDAKGAKNNDEAIIIYSHFSSAISCIREYQRREAVMREALREISLGKGRFSMDEFEHARNTIEDMKELAQQALEQITTTTESGDINTTENKTSIG